MLPGTIIGHSLNSGGGWSGDHEIESYVASEVHVKGFKSQEVGFKKLQEVSVFPCADGSLGQEGHAQRQTLRHQRVERFDDEEVPPTVGEARSDPLQSAWG